MRMRDDPARALAGRARLAAGLELLLTPLLLALKYYAVLRNPTLLLFLFGWLSLRLRKVGWRGVGLTRPADWPTAAGAAILIGLAYNALDIFILIPGLHRLTGESVELAQLGELKGQLGKLIVTLAVIWPLAAFCEEMTWRGYLLNRAADFFGRSRLMQGLGVALVSLAFGLAHLNQGLTGILDNLLAGLLFAGLYLLSRRNLWLPILAHGVIDSSSLVLLYLGVHPR
jgi:membrane protease YdiL (CAAX protease family)